MGLHVLSGFNTSWEHGTDLIGDLHSNVSNAENTGQRCVELGCSGLLLVTTLTCSLEQEVLYLKRVLLLETREGAESAIWNAYTDFGLEPGRMSQPTYTRLKFKPRSRHLRESQACN